jgi:hypothetical protein
MKKARFLFTIVAFGAWTLGVGYAGEPSGQPAKQETRQNHAARDASGKAAQGRQERGKIDQKDGKESKPKADGHASEKGGKDRAAKSGAKRPLEREPHRLEPKKTAAAAKDGRMMIKKATFHEPPARLAAGKQAVAPRPGVVPSRSATTSAAGGAAVAATKHPGLTLNGSDFIKHKTY